MKVSYEKGGEQIEVGTKTGGREEKSRPPQRHVALTEEVKCPFEAGISRGSSEDEDIYENLTN